MRETRTPVLKMYQGTVDWPCLVLYAFAADLEDEKVPGESVLGWGER